MNLFIISILYAFSLFFTDTEIKRRARADQDCLKITGRAITGERTSKEFKVKLFLENECVDSLVLSKPSSVFSYKLKCDRNYTIQIEVEEYYTKRISISTALPDIKLKPIFQFEFELEMEKIDPSVSDFYYDFPVGVVSYNFDQDEFQSNFKYQSHISEMIKGSKTVMAQVQ